ncbi:hypothetical protein ACF9IK_08880 [Kitasatospora hibisci]|uniref:hypothetical protein n=1 Tax=Kitasatospora hibisci TaxID=3369522 RepID=UPI0037553CF6
MDTALTVEMNRQAKKNGQPVVSDVVAYLLEDGEVDSALSVVGRESLPTLARIDRYADTEFDHYFCELALAELDRIAARDLPAATVSFLSELSRLLQQALDHPGYIVRFIGD